jgi:type II secretory pathway pseudopilin PulG
MMNKRAQEEMVGFVLIVVIVVVISVILLGISLRSDSTQSVEESEELNSFLSSVAQITSDCEKPKNDFLVIGDLVKKCYDNQVCSDERIICDVLSSTLEDVLESSTYVVDEDSANQYYDLKIFYENNGERVRVIEDISEVSKAGDCLGNKIYNEKEFTAVDGERLFMRFEVCYV